MKQTFETTIVLAGSACFIPVPFDPKPVFGRAISALRAATRAFGF